MVYSIEFANGVYNVMLNGKVIYSTKNYPAAEMYLNHLERGAH
jgi:hypothetical protein